MLWWYLWLPSAYDSGLSSPFHLADLPGPCLTGLSNWTAPCLLYIFHVFTLFLDTQCHPMSLAWLERCNISYFTEPSVSFPFRCWLPYLGWGWVGLLGLMDQGLYLQGLLQLLFLALCVQLQLPEVGLKLPQLLPSLPQLPVFLLRQRLHILTSFQVCKIIADESFLCYAIVTIPVQ